VHQPEVSQVENLDVTVLRQLLLWRREGQRALLVTVIRTFGSSPRPVGSIMALCESGAVAGSVSGGCIEDDLIYRYSRGRTPADTAPVDGISHAIPVGPPERIIYGVNADEAHRFGLPCGGTLELLLEFNPDPDLLEALVQALAAGHLMIRDTHLATGLVTQLRCDKPVPIGDDGARIRNCFGPEYRMLLIGAGQLTEYLATMALFCGFAVTVCDPREEYRSSWAIKGVEVLRGMPDDVVQAFELDRRSCVIALTHDPKLDDLALLEALGSDAFYVGAIGSRRNNEARRARLIAHFDQTEESLSGLRGPVGIYIGSKTPPEIAVSIMSEVLAVKNAVPLPREMQIGPAKNGLLPVSADSGLVRGTSSDYRP
jgi:xanthine dehydrogenase accessory factor